MGPNKTVCYNPFHSFYILLLHLQTVIIILATETLPMGQLLQCLPTSLFAFRPGRDERQLRCVQCLLQVPPKLHGIIRNFAQPDFLRLLGSRVNPNICRKRNSISRFSLRKVSSWRLLSRQRQPSGVIKVMCFLVSDHTTWYPSCSTL